MGFLKRFLDGGNPTASWVRDQGLRLEFDFSSNSLCGVGLGEPVERLSALGPAEDRAKARKGELKYLSLGLSLGVDGGLVTDFRLAWRDYLDEGYSPFPGTCVFRGKDVGFGPGTDEADILRHFGEPYWRDQDECERLLFFEVPSGIGRFVEWQVELDLEGKLKAILIVPPLLAEEVNRTSFGVTKPWPPG